MQVSPLISSRRLSTMSASAPAPSANKNIRTIEATWTKDTMNGPAFRLIISQPEGPLYIQVPMLDDGRGPDDRERAMPKRAPGRARDCRCLITSFGFFASLPHILSPWIRYQAGQVQGAEVRKSAARKASVRVPTTRALSSTKNRGLWFGAAFAGSFPRGVTPR